ncbi:MAG: hypothetical protein CVU33_18925 [Betaproteobacteria bacterium HGW-Betaproteobacteria-6]|jgi:hypothetical protein|nr:MAG: hypothetical protein CVU33_18925 [Betaproteobacteria bacterium HGW-Betaproteobacteria-6]
MLVLSGTEAATGPLAQIARVGVNVVECTDALKQPGRVERRMPTARFVMYEQQAQGSGPQFAAWHGGSLLKNQAERPANISQRSRPANEVLKSRLDMIDDLLLRMIRILQGCILFVNENDYQVLIWTMRRRENTR